MTLPTYAYNASAIGLGGVIRQGKRTTVIPTLASVCLATAGGEASNSVDYYDRDGISFTRAQTRVGGYSSTRGRSDGVRHSTFAEVLLLNLRIFDRISIARMQAVVTSTRDIDSGDPNSELVPDRTRFSVKLLYHGVEVDGEEIDAEIDTQLCEASSYKNFAEMLNARKQKLLPETQNALKAQAALQNAPVSGPLVAFPGHARALANRLPLPAFGHARFGDVIVKPDRQRVSLLRLTLDADWSPEKPTQRRRVVRTAALLAENEPTTSGDGTGTGGSVSSGDSGSNGVPIWP